MECVNERARQQQLKTKPNVWVMIDAENAMKHPYTRCRDVVEKQKSL